MSTPQFDPKRNPKYDPKKRSDEPESKKKRYPLGDEESIRQRQRDRDRDHDEPSDEQGERVLGGEA